MIRALPEVWFVVVWVVFSVLALAALAAVLVWAIRTGQFRDQDRLRRLPLDSGIPEDDAWPPATTAKQKKPKSCSD